MMLFLKGLELGLAFEEDMKASDDGTAGLRVRTAGVGIDVRVEK